ncbi:hypothetical protein ONZ45_g14498 [Pleurotus djamor]|nr:hypothetical protein ONZ45_g14498 [Pleurotus djamor]
MASLITLATTIFLAALLRWFARPIIVLSSVASATELLNRRSALTSSRPLGTMLYKLMGWDWNLALTPYGDVWRARRRVFWQEFNRSQAVYHHPIQIKHSHRFLRRLLATPSDFYKHVRYSTAAAIIESTYGLEVELHNDPHIARSEVGIEHFDNAVVHGAFLVDTFPFLQYIPRWFPGAGFRKFADLAYKDTMLMINTPFDEAVKLHNKGEISVVSRALSRAVKAPENASHEKTVKDVAAMAYAAGVDTTQSPLLAFFAAMTLFPDVQRKAQKEVDFVLGEDPDSRLPTFNDLPSLVATGSTPRYDILKTLRYLGTDSHCLKPGFFHLSTEDDVYNGYHLPKGSIVCCNVWSIFRDPEIFPNPERFIPERFIDESGQLNKELIEIVELGFGFGRRKCPGRYFAWDSVWIFMVSTLCVFDIQPAKDEFGEDIIPEIELEPILITKLRPFKCSVTPRSEHSTKLISNQVDD